MDSHFRVLSSDSESFNKSKQEKESSSPILMQNKDVGPVYRTVFGAFKENSLHSIESALERPVFVSIEI